MSLGRTHEQGGFTLVELLVVIAIIGILASVAMTQYAFYKERAVDADMESTLHAARHGMEAYFVANVTYVGVDESTLHDDYGFRRSPTMSFTVPDAQALTYQIQVCAPGGSVPGYFYDSTVGSTQPATGCP